MVRTGWARGLVALLVVAPVALAGCTSSKSGKPAPTTPISTPVSAPVSTPAASETVTPAEVRAAMLTPADVGRGFTRARFQPSNDPLPCKPNDPPVETQFPSTLRVGTAIASTRVGAGLAEDVHLYADTPTAQQVMGVIEVGVNCPRGSLNLTGKPEPVRFGSLQNVTPAVGADEAYAVEARSARLDIVLVATRLDRAVILFSFVRTKSTPTSELPNPIQIVATAIAKIKAASGR
jgi:hypothetical protein